ncbi:thermonuclease family protein [Candidatus Williamhamiltonella defendens]|uniref:Nuclease n=1 Tax=Candidatus Hamiltonella defensa (Bemisia tabaci) TaxID=672795 RepID=A0A249DX00_9ENTR|nr:thermonuclease family protein [Candidatus Hamiltonella defensa]ASX25971.1 nuclease [Candidatus Hamiltonella defensa (Bemisia tabaci)]CED78500.1 SNase-like micrococcal nuclease [Candidatus Hamiltonella defensa (Bemisia tabaci)]
MKNILILLITGLLSAFSWADDITGRVVSVHDGDTLILLTPEQKQIKIRLAEIDTPEIGQPYGNQAKKALADLVFDQTLTARSNQKDRYGRVLAQLYLGEVWINAEMIKQGDAWVYRQHSRDPRLLAFETQAREEKKGLWALPESQRVPPWEWRKSRWTQRKHSPLLSNPPHEPVAPNAPAHK